MAFLVPFRCFLPSPCPTLEFVLPPLRSLLALALATLLREETPAVLVHGESGYAGIVTTADLV